MKKKWKRSLHLVQILQIFIFIHSSFLLKWFRIFFYNSWTLWFDLVILRQHSKSKILSVLELGVCLPVYLSYMQNKPFGYDMFEDLAPLKTLQICFLTFEVTTTFNSAPTRSARDIIIWQSSKVVKCLHCVLFLIFLKGK